MALRWLIQQPNIIAIPKAANEAHLRENFDVSHYPLTEEEVDKVLELRGELLARLGSYID